MKFATPFIFGLSLVLTVSAQSNRWLNDYEGTVGTAKIGLTLASTTIGGFDRGDNIECSYFYVSQLKDIDLKCSIGIDGSFTFKELDEKGKIRATFRGKFLKNERGMAEGIWTRAGQARSLPFRMNSEQGVSSTDGNRYAMIDAPDAEGFEKKVREFRNAVLTVDKQKAVSQIKYPIKVRVNKKNVWVRNKAAMLAHYDRVFTREFIADIKKTIPHNMFKRDIGAMLGQGLIWFWGDGKVIAINN